MADLRVAFADFHTGFHVGPPPPPPISLHTLTHTTTTFPPPRRFHAVSFLYAIWRAQFYVGECSSTFKSAVLRWTVSAVLRWRVQFYVGECSHTLGSAAIRWTVSAVLRWRVQFYVACFCSSVRLQLFHNTKLIAGLRHVRPQYCARRSTFHQCHGNLLLERFLFHRQTVPHLQN